MARRIQFAVLKSHIEVTPFTHWLPTYLFVVPSTSLKSMYEYVAFNPFNSSPESLAAELTKKSAEGWEVVDIVTTFDGRYCAFLRRPTQGAASNSTANTSVTAQITVTETTPTSAAAPAAWYADPSNRFELRYWDGSEWTEHVARGGQQFTDPPIA
jgi:hypothetical protein